MRTATCSNLQSEISNTILFNSSITFLLLSSLQIKKTEIKEELKDLSVKGWVKIDMKSLVFFPSYYNLLTDLEIRHWFQMRENGSTIRNQNPIIIR